MWLQITMAHSFPMKILNSNEHLLKNSRSHFLAIMPNSLNDIKHFFSFYNFHYSVDFPLKRVNVHFVNLHNVDVVEFSSKNKLLFQQKFELIVFIIVDNFHSKLFFGNSIETSLHNSRDSLAQCFLLIIEIFKIPTNQKNIVSAVGRIIFIKLSHRWLRLFAMKSRHCAEGVFCFIRHNVIRSRHVTLRRHPKRIVLAFQFVSHQRISDHVSLRRCRFFAGKSIQNRSVRIFVFSRLILFCRLMFLRLIHFFYRFYFII
mmetsp:Transcript_75584/g.87886  ORF Transcript_75584/g.87886 Transcript_75584/m.87886 type:complete len:259 (+) Transcript_75584:162-938(+)